MIIVFASYVYTPDFDDPQQWINRIKGYVVIQESLALTNTVISIEQINYEGQYEDEGVQYHFKKYSKIDRRFPYKLHRYIKSLNPDVIFIHGLHFSLQIIQLRLSLNSKVKIIAQHHAEQPHTGIRKLVQQIADRGINAYLFASRDMGLDWVNRGNLASPDKIHGVMEVSSIFYPIDKTIAIAKTGVTGAPIFLWVGRLDQNKDPLNVVAAFLQFAKLNPLARLYMIYQTEELLAGIINLLDQHPQQRKAIVLIGKIPHPDLLYWFNSADFIISGSYYEGSGTVVCEAMSCGCVPVVTDILSFRMMTDNGDCGLLYQPGNEAELLARLVQATNINMKEMQQRVINYYETNLSFSAIAGRIEEIAASL